MAPVHHLAEVLTAEAKLWPGTTPPGEVGARMSAGIAPFWFIGRFTPEYEAVFLGEQLCSALCDDPVGPLDVWIWVSGGLTPENLARINATVTEPRGAADYTDLLRAYSGNNGNGTDLCQFKWRAHCCNSDCTTGQDRPLERLQWPL